MKVQLKHTATIVGAAVVSVAALVIFLGIREPGGIAPMGDEAEVVGWISLAIAGLSLVTAVVGLIQKVIELRTAKRD